MKPLQNPALTALGATTIICMTWLAPISSDLHQTVYKLSGSLTAVLVPLYIVMACIWLFWFLALKLSWNQPKASLWVGIVLTVVLFRELIEDGYALTSPDLSDALVKPPHSVNILSRFLIVAIIALILVLHSRAPKLMGQARALGLAVLGFVALSGAFTILRDAVWGYEGRNLNTAHPLHQHAANAGPVKGPPHVIWVLMDELSYRQVYEHRYPDLEMPAFDKLAQTSTVFTNVRPAGRYTLNVIPSLLSGIPDTNSKSGPAGQPLYLKNADTGRWQQLDPAQTVFQDALNAGYSTAVSGWVIPYCRLFSAQLDHCFSSLGGSWLPQMNTTVSITQNLKPAFLIPMRDRANEFGLLKIWRLVFGSPQAPSTFEAAETSVPASADGNGPPPDGPAKAYEVLTQNGGRFLDDPSINFLYMHLDDPHPLGYFNRHIHKFDNNGTYIDNLALCDQFLANLRTRLEANGTWNDTTLVIMGDHSWRTYEWKKERWTDEEQRASDGGQFDDRPGYIVHLAGQTTPLRIDSSYEAVRTRSMMDTILQGQIKTPEQLQAWTK